MEEWTRDSNFEDKLSEARVHLLGSLLGPRAW